MLLKRFLSARRQTISRQPSTRTETLRPFKTSRLTRRNNEQRRDSSLAIVASFRLEEEAARGSIARRENGGQADRGEEKKEKRRMHVRVCIVHDLDCMAAAKTKVSAYVRASVRWLARGNRLPVKRRAEIPAEIAPGDSSRASCTTLSSRRSILSFSFSFFLAFLPILSQLRSKYSVLNVERS